MIARGLNALGGLIARGLNAIGIAVVVAVTPHADRYASVAADVRSAEPTDIRTVTVIADARTFDVPTAAVATGPLVSVPAESRWYDAGADDRAVAAPSRNDGADVANDARACAVPVEPRTADVPAVSSATAPVRRTTEVIA